MSEDNTEPRRPLLVTAHRGFSGRAPENTLAAFGAAIEAGCDLIELDVHLTRDRRVIVIHDDTLGRTTSGRGHVADKILAELRKLDAGAWFAPCFAGERIPTLEEVLVLARGRIGVNIELKRGKGLPYTMEELADRTLAVVCKAGMQEQVLFSSFSPEAVDRIGMRDSRLAIGLIVDRAWKRPEDPGAGKRYPVLNCRADLLNSRNIRSAQAEGIVVHAWSVDRPEEMERLIALGVDGIITNHPDRIIEILKRPPKNNR